jgi:hypothetical protein
MVLIRIVTFVFYILIFTSITTISPLAYGQDEDEEDDQDQIPQVNDPGLQVELVTASFTR